MEFSLLSTVTMSKGDHSFTKTSAVVFSCAMLQVIAKEGVADPTWVQSNSNKMVCSDYFVVDPMVYKSTVNNT